MYAFAMNGGAEYNVIFRGRAGVILASGMSEYKPESDNFVSDIFERADKEMYEEKQRLKT